MTEQRTNMKATRFLADLPEVIETRDVRVMAGWERKAAIEAMSRWADAGYIRQFAYGTYFNLIKSPQGPQTHVFEAAQRVVRRPMVLVGASALRDGGWTTQMPSGYELAIATDRNIRTWKRMAGITAEPRLMKWFAKVSQFTIRSDGDFDRLPPAFALVDTIASAGRYASLSREAREELMGIGRVNWHPHPDDISLPVDKDPREAWDEMIEAAEILGVPYEIVREYASAIPDLGEVAISPSSPPPARRRGPSR